MIEVKIDNIFVVQNQIERLQQGVENRYILMRRLAETMHMEVRKNFRYGGRPKWLGLKYRNGKPLTDTGALRNSLSTMYDNDTALVGTNIVYAAIHNFGGMAGRGRKVHIPQRKFLVLDNSGKQKLADEVQDYFRSLIR
ncbi:phage virion morphogenesis protein [Bergeriella denitrificans]|uniref:Putative phage tail completion protein n=1 Tax=Bergeriella denitrificans TaxID=494 RepID=A0A378UI14_BERDE|nr:phage virion morphogenesis protein [Bergeriella denitrificans]STZ76329.1 putative phage tail completion protein [Bergeriella denitrificans]